MCRFLPVVNASPDNFEAPLRFKLDDADIQFLIQYNCRGGACVGW